MQSCRRWIVISALIIICNVPVVTGVDGQFQQTISLAEAPPPCPWCFFSSGRAMILELLPEEKEIDSLISEEISGSEEELGNGGFADFIQAELNSAENDVIQVTGGSLREFQSTDVTLGKSNTIITVSMPHQAVTNDNDSENQATADTKFNLQVEGNKTNEKESAQTSIVTINLSGQPAKLSVNARANLQEDSNLLEQYKGKNTITFLFH